MGRTPSSPAGAHELWEQLAFPHSYVRTYHTAPRSVLTHSRKRTEDPCPTGRVFKCLQAPRLGLDLQTPERPIPAEGAGVVPCAAPVLDTERVARLRGKPGELPGHHGRGSG